MNTATKTLLVALFCTFTLSAVPAYAKKGDKDNAEKVNVDKIKEKYWAKGDESALGVVQNRLYSKEKRFQLGILGGFHSSDPFLTTKVVGFTAGYHFSEYISALLVWMNYSPSASAASDTLLLLNTNANTNLPKDFMGGEVDFSILYGKLSLLGKSIIYFDLYTNVGMGLTRTETGNYFTPTFGLGQRFFLSQHFSIKLDYHLHYFKETLIEKTVQALLNQPVGTRNNFTHIITFGVDFMF